MTFGGIALGARGERLAAQWYRANGYQLVARNWTCPIGELDLIVRRGDELVFVEVKTRGSDRYGLPSEAVGIAKQRKLRALASAWLSTTTEYFAEIRFDVVSIIGNDVSVIQAAF
ncbi:MAG: YraN family protein [Actinobacteria bacterium]|nr:YraN family protein [Actinomycetota bacterium]